MKNLLPHLMLNVYSLNYNVVELSRHTPKLHQTSHCKVVPAAPYCVIKGDINAAASQNCDHQVLISTEENITRRVMITYPASINYLLHFAFFFHSLSTRPEWINLFLISTRGSCGPGRIHLCYDGITKFQIIDEHKGHMRILHTIG